MKRLFFAILASICMKPLDSLAQLKATKEKVVVLTKEAPSPIGPYSQAVKNNSMIFVSGQIAIEPKTGVMDTTNIAGEATRVMENIKAILKEAGLNFTHVVKTTIYLTDLNSFNIVNEVYSKYVGNVAPARETVEVNRLPKGAHVEISVIAMP